jgi:hypothetical protein
VRAPGGGEHHTRRGVVLLHEVRERVAVHAAQRAGGRDEGLAQSAVERDGVHGFHHEVRGVSREFGHLGFQRVRHVRHLVVRQLGVHHGVREQLHRFG